VKDPLQERSQDLKKLVIASAVLVLCSGGLLSAAGAGTVVVSGIEGFTPSEESGTSTLYLEKNRCRMEFEGKSSHSALIYTHDGESMPVLYLVDEQSKGYIRLEQKDLKAVKEQIAQQMDAMDKYINDLEPAQQDAMRKKYAKEWKRMEGIVKPRDETRFEYKPVSGPATKVNNWDANQYQCFVDGELEDDIWIAGWGETGLHREDVAIIADMYESFGEMAGTASFFAMMWNRGELDGFPVQVVAYQGGEKTRRTTVKEVRTQDLNNSLFELTDEYFEQSFFKQ